MGIDVQLRNEDGEVLVDVGDRAMALSRAARGAMSGTRLLKYLVPWGDAVFNQAQAGNLAHDIRDLMNAHPGTPLASLLMDVQPLVERLSTETHSYLWFVGD
jgi:hypothetical protein